MGRRAARWTSLGVSDPPEHHRDPRTRQEGFKHIQAPPSQGQRGAAANTPGTQTPAAVSPLLPPAERDTPPNKKSPSLLPATFKGVLSPATGPAPGARGAAVPRSAQRLTYFIARCRAGTGEREQTSAVGRGCPGGCPTGRAWERCPAVTRIAKELPGPGKAPLLSHLPRVRFPELIDPRCKPPPPPTAKVKPGTRNVGKAEHGPGDVSPTPHASQNPTQGQLAVANLEGNSGGPQNPLSLRSPPSTSCRGGLQPAVSTSFRSKSRSTCLAAKAGPAC